MRSLGLVLFASILAAFAVQLGFGAAFVSDVVAWVTTAYTTGLCVLLIPRDTESGHFSQRLWVRLPLGFTVGGLVLALLRGPLLFDLPGFEFVTTGHTPFLVFPVSASSTLGVLALLARVVRRSARPASISAEPDTSDARR